jgi:hypothetical protein
MGERRSPDAPFSLRLSFEERAQLEGAAAGMPLGTYIREQLFGGELRPRRTRGQRPLKDHEALARVLAELGRSRIASNLNQLARAANSGSLPMTEETERALHKACQAVALLRGEIIRALGLSAPEPLVEEPVP